MQENFGRQEQNFESHYNEILETLAQKYEEKIQALGEKKKEKLEALYGQLVSCGENLDTCKELMETIEEMCHEEKVDFIKVSSKEFPLWYKGIRASLQHQDTGSIPGLAQWVKRSGIAIAAA